MLQLVHASAVRPSALAIHRMKSAKQASLCGRQSCLQAAFQAAFSIRVEFLGLRRFRAGGHEA
jgi:hypothetical protein